MSVQNQKYIPWLDFVRVTSIFFVIIIHIVGPLFNNWKRPFPVWMAGNFYNSIARVSVPLLFMVSGYLLLNRQESVGSFYKNRVRKVVLPFLLWSIIYWVWKNYKHMDYSFFNTVKSMLVSILMHPAYYHFWFIYALLAIYLFVPVLQVFVHAADDSHLKYFALLWFICGPVLDFVQQKILNYNILLDLGFFTEYIGYFYLGYVIGRMEFSRRTSTIAGIIYLILAGVTMYATYKVSLQRGRYNDFYHNYLRLNIAAMAVCAYVWLKQVGTNLTTNSKAAAVFRSLSLASFGIYLIHVMVLTYVQSGMHFLKFVPALTSSPYLMPWVFAILTFTISYGIIFVLQKIPYVRSIVPS